MKILEGHLIISIKGMFLTRRNYLKIKELVKLHPSLRAMCQRYLSIRRRNQKVYLLMLARIYLEVVMSRIISLLGSSLYIKIPLLLIKSGNTKIKPISRSFPPKVGKIHLLANWLIKVNENTTNSKCKECKVT